MIVLQGKIDDKYGFGRCILLTSDFDSIRANSPGDGDPPFHSNHDNRLPFLSKRRNNQPFNQNRNEMQKNRQPDSSLLVIVLYNHQVQFPFPILLSNPHHLLYFLLLVTNSSLIYDIDLI
jgi:hypothetical protein